MEEGKTEGKEARKEGEEEREWEGRGLERGTERKPKNGKGEHKKWMNETKSQDEMWVDVNKEGEKREKSRVLMD